MVFGYTGKYLDDATGYQNNVNRWYDSNLGQWFSEDPKGFDGGDENLRRYVNNSTPNNTDPFGLEINDPYVQHVKDDQSLMAYASAMYGAGMQSMADSAATPWRYAQARLAEARYGMTPEVEAMYNEAYRRSPYGQTENDYAMHMATKAAWYTAFTSAEMLLQIKTVRVGTQLAICARDYKYGKAMFEMAQVKRNQALEYAANAIKGAKIYEKFFKKAQQEIEQNGPRLSKALQEAIENYSMAEAVIYHNLKAAAKAQAAMYRYLKEAYTAAQFRNGI